MKPKLYKFQRQDVDRLHGDLEGRALIANEVGLGKTIEAYTFLVEAEDSFPCLIICPANLKLNWQREGQRLFGLDSTILEGRKPVVFKSYRTKKIFIINFDILEQWLPWLKSKKFKTLIIDEGQKIVNLQSKSCKFTMELSKGIEQLLILTGTPIVNRHYDLYAFLHMLDRNRFDSAFSFGMEFCTCEEARGELVFRDSVNREKLNRILKDYMIRRIKEDVMKDLPKLTKTVLAFEIENRKEYEYAELDFLRWLASYDLAAADRAARNERLTRFNYLKRLAIKCKMASVIAWIDDFLANSDGKLILGALHRKTWPHTISMIEEKYKGSVSVHGGKTKLRKQDAIDQFQNDPKTRIITLQLKSGGTGYNLQGAKRSMGLIEMPWHPADVTQFIGRGHRIGTLDAVNCWFFLAANTIEEKLCSIIQNKSKIYDKTIDGKEVTLNSLNLLDELHLAMLANKGTIAKKKRKK